MRKIILILIIASACSSLSKNFIQTGEFTIAGGIARDKVWSSALVFNHYSWFQGLTLVFDLKIAKVARNSDFSNWFSPVEKSLVSDCGDFYVTLTYEKDSEQISRANLFTDLAKKGYKKVIIENFANNLKMHPSFNDVSLGLYKIFGLCKESLEKTPVQISFPGYGDKELNL